MTFDWCSTQMKAAGFSSNTKVPCQLDGKVIFNDLTFKTDFDTVVTLGRCQVDFSNRQIVDDEGKIYTWWTPSN